MLIYHNIPIISGVYIIKCNANEKIYIGSTGSLRDKINKYKVDLECKSLRVKEMNEDIEKYGRESFEIDYLCTCNYEISTRIERYYIKKYKAKQFGYNSINASNNIVYNKKYRYEPRGDMALFDNATNKVLNWFVIDMINLDDFGETELVTLAGIEAEIKNRYKAQVDLNVLFGIINKLDLICYIKDNQYDNLYYIICGTQLANLIYDRNFFIKNGLEKRLIRIVGGSLDLDDILIEIPLLKNRYCKSYDTNFFVEKNIVIDLKNNKWFNYV